MYLSRSFRSSWPSGVIGGFGTWPFFWLAGLPLCFAISEGGRGATGCRNPEQLRSLPTTPTVCQYTSDARRCSVLAPLPATLEQRQVVVLAIGVPLDLVDIQVDPQSGPVWNVDIAVLHLHRIGNDLLLPRLIELVEDFVDQE